MLELLQKWETVYRNPDLSLEYIDVHDFCIGWCMAQGLNQAEGEEFWNLCRDKGLY